MGEHIQKEVTKGLLRQGIKQNKPYFKEVIIFSIIGLILLVGYFINGDITGNVISEFNYGELETTTTYDFWTLGNSTGTLQVDYAIVDPEQKYINSTFYCYNGSISSDVSSLLYLWYINGSLAPNLNTSSIVSGYPTNFRNFTIYDKLECGIVPQNGSNLVAYWPFDEGSGITFKDIVNNNSGTSTTADWKRGRNYYSINISLNNYYDVNIPVGLNLTNNFTYELWIFPTEFANSVIIDNGGQVYIKLENGKIKGYLKILETMTSLKIISVDNIQLNKWNQIVMTYDNKNSSIYLNGLLQNSTNVTGDVVNFTGNIAIGRNSANDQEYFRGQIDEIAIYNGSLNAAEIQNHFNRGIVILSKENKLILDVTEAIFSEGTLTNITYSSSAGGLILSNCSTNVYCLTGEYISSIKRIQDNEYPGKIFYGMKPISSGNITFLVKTGTISNNNSVVYSTYSAEDPAYSNNSNIVLALPFSEGKGNITEDLATGGKYYLANTDFIPNGKIGTALRLFGNGGLTINDFSDIRLSNPNYTIELFIKPNVIDDMIIFSKNRYFLYLNDSLNVIYNATCEDGIQYSLISNSSLQINQWSYIVITHDSMNNSKLYINGILKASGTINSSIVSLTSDLILGSSENFNAFNGSIDSFVINNRTLNTDEIINRVNSLNPQGGYFDVNDYIQYKALFSSTDNTKTPVLTNISIRLQNYSVYVFNSPPENISLIAPTNNTNITEEFYIFNWSQALDLENNSVYYEWVLSNYSNLSNIVDSHYAINNYSLQNYSDQKTLLVEHFDYKEDLLNHGWDGNWSNTITNGKYKNGFELTQPGKYLRLYTAIFDPNEGAIEFWVKPYWNSNDSNTNYFFEHTSKVLALNRTGTQIKYSVGINNPVYLTYNISEWSYGEWHHVAVYWKNQGNISLILDGVQVNTTTIGSINSMSTEGFFLGSSALTSNNIVINGVIDELRISNVKRESPSCCNSNDILVNFTNISDGDYYWTIKAIQKWNYSFDNENNEQETQIWKVNINSKMPQITFVEDYVKQYNEVTATINISSSEDVSCQYSTYNDVLGNMNRTEETEHSQQLNITNFGNYTYYFNCNDSNNNFANRTFSFYVFNKSEEAVVNNTITNFTSTVKKVMNFSIVGEEIGYLEITTKNNMNYSNAGMIEHFYDKNPENFSNGLESSILGFWTVFLDDNLVANLTGNVTVGFMYDEDNTRSFNPTNVSLYWFNPKTSAWEYQGVNVLTNTFFAVINTSRFGTFALSGNGSAAVVVTPPPAVGNNEGKSLIQKNDVITEAECYSDYDCFDGYICEYNFCVEEIIYSEIIIEEEHIEIDEEQTNLFQDIEDLAGSILKSAGLLEENKLLLTLVYVLILGGIVFYGYRMSLALLFKFQKKKLMKIEDLEKNIDDKIKYYAYNHINKKNLKEELLKKGFSESRVNNLLSNVNKLRKEKFEDYIYKSLAKGDNEQDILKRLIDKGWEEINIKKEIENFKRI